MFEKAKKIVRNPKVQAVVAAAVVAGAASYGVPPEYSQQALAYIANLLGL